MRMENCTVSPKRPIFLSFRDVATGPDQGKYLMAPNAARKLFRIKPNLF